MPVHILKANTVVEVEFHSFLWLALDESGKLHVPVALPRTKGSGIR